MKSLKLKALLLLAITFGLVSWSPPNNESLIVGLNNTFRSSTGYLGIIGSDNFFDARSSLVVGTANTASYESPSNDSTTTFTNSILSGTSNVVKNSASRCMISGNGNSIQANSTVVSGTNNTLAGATVGTPTLNSVAMGGNNQIAAGHGWVLGYNNTVTGDYGVTLGYGNNVSGWRGHVLGTGLTTNQPESLALGKYNAPLVTNDVVVVGCGTATLPNTALRITSDGGVILGRAQGDISMGAYQ